MTTAHHSPVFRLLIAGNIKLHLMLSPPPLFFLFQLRITDHQVYLACTLKRCCNKNYQKLLEVAHVTPILHIHSWV